MNGQNDSNKATQRQLPSHHYEVSNIQQVNMESPGKQNNQKNLYEDVNPTKNTQSQFQQNQSIDDGRIYHTLEDQENIYE